MMEKKEYTLTVFTEHQTGVLQRVVTVFTRRHINVEALTTSQSSIEGIHRFTIKVLVTEDMVNKLVAQLDKQVDVLKSYAYENNEIVHQELALYKVPLEAFTAGQQLEKLVRKHNARILEIEPEFVVIEKTGQQHETEALLDELKEEVGIYEFVRSGRVAIIKPMERLNKYLKSLEEEAALSTWT
ncbi:MAG: acetolactate synthase small subunit [Bacteroidota bacterium]